jgi:hypothetical protein
MTRPCSAPWRRLSRAIGRNTPRLYDPETQRGDCLPSGSPPREKAPRRARAGETRTGQRRGDERFGTSQRRGDERFVVVSGRLLRDTHAPASVRACRAPRCRVTVPWTDRTLDGDVVPTGGRVVRGSGTDLTARRTRAPRSRGSGGRSARRSRPARRLREHRHVGTGDGPQGPGADRGYASQRPPDLARTGPDQPARGNVSAASSPAGGTRTRAEQSRVAHRSERPVEVRRIARPS